MGYVKHCCFCVTRSNTLNAPKQLKPADLDAISPLEVVKNPHGGRHPMKKFSRYQVEALARRLDFEKSLAVEIVRTRAMEKYDVSAHSLFSTPL